jgi:transcriptional regulator with XRE-family HTH domain
MAVAARAEGAGPLLREWRRRRNLSQLELALGSAVSTRHLSFIETGRAKPSREMVLHLADRLDVPLRERNRLLLAAGYAPVFPEHELDDDALAPVRGALERFLSAHEPYPAIVVDRRWDIVLGNHAAAALTAGVAQHVLQPRPNAYRIALHPEGMAPRIVNFGEWSGHLLHRLRRQAALSGDPQLASLYDELAGYPRVNADFAEVGGDEIVLPLQLRDGGRTLSFFTTVSTFGTAVDVTLSELTVEAFYPADEQTQQALRHA